jgi:hypothetical protein
MTGREAFNFEEAKRRIMAERRVCEVCGNPGVQLAHRIPQSSYNLYAYGRAIIHHELNLALVCGLECNSKVNIGQVPAKKWELLKEIEKQL